MFADYIPSTKGEDSFRVPYADLDALLIDALVLELELAPTPAEA
jgi:hypothetical protein